MNLIYYELMQYTLEIALVKLKQIHKNMAESSSLDSEWEKVRNEFIDVYVELHNTGSPKGDKYE